MNEVLLSNLDDKLMQRSKDADLARAGVLDDLASRLTAASAKDSRDDFRTLIEMSQKVLHLDDTVASRKLKVSRPTIGRWVRGDAAPHPLVRKAIFDVLVGLARSEAKTLRS